ncbi:interleukin-1 receptor accessory protein-like isoform X1 [Synchiropus splendidus]|uniref:interleukin-1 receptor accessory protein-like isoform X1 n=1 Tax=Synchiropus splendidus TaxID=270530 RepID=UPI00237E0AC4|nr:interleukin-1 receptor accessory protein-like isoform X1 [Synchiropus splendidus]
MKVKVSLLLLLLSSLTGLCDLQKSYVTRGELVALHCPSFSDSDGSNTTWTSYTSLPKDLSQMSAAEQREAEVLLHQDHFVIFSASEKHQGNYSCTVGGTEQQIWFTLIVQEHVDPNGYYEHHCSERQSCTLQCADPSVPEELTSNVTWNKDGDSGMEDHGFFPSVTQTDGGLYNCTRFYQYQGRTYYKHFIVKLIVESEEDFPVYEKIIVPKDKQVFQVDLGQKAEILCEANARVIWIVGDEFVDQNDSLRIHSNSSWNNDGKASAWLIFKSVLEEDLPKNYTCKLDSQWVTVTLAKNVPVSYVPLALSIVGIIALLVIAVAVYAKFKIEIKLYLRDSLGCHRQHSDAKQYDAFLLCYKSETDSGLKENDLKWLHSILEEKFGYTICDFHRDVLPGEVVAEVVLDCIEQSRAVVLVPSTTDPGLGSSLPSTIHEALVERKANLIFLKTKSKVEGATSLSESVELLHEPGHCVNWEGLSSMQPSSSFWKQLRYRLPAPSSSRGPKTTHQKMQNPCDNV